MTPTDWQGSKVPKAYARASRRKGVGTSTSRLEALEQHLEEGGNYYLVYHSAFGSDHAAEIVWASSPEEAERLTRYDGTYKTELWNASKDSRKLFNSITKRGLKALKEGEVIRVAEWHEEED